MPCQTQSGKRFNKKRPKERTKNSLASSGIATCQAAAVRRQNRRFGGCQSMVASVGNNIGAPLEYMQHADPPALTAWS